MRYPTKRPTGSELAVIAVVFSLLCIVFGTIALVIAARAPADKEDLAARLWLAGECSLGIGIIIALGLVLARWLLRR